MDNQEIFKKEYGNITVVDPNKLQSGKNDYVDRYVNQEDLVMYARLDVYSNGKTIKADKEPIYSIESVHVNFLNPAGNGELSTRWTELFDENRPYASETFGISTIKIEYNASYIATVSIEFLDVRGKTLFERGDDPNNPYNLFFQFPYPQFSLTVKGYYGRTVTLPLILEKSNTSFDAQSGDYRTSTTFRSFTFAMLNDIPLRYLVQAPYMYEQTVGDNKGYQGLSILVKLLKEYSKPADLGGLSADLCHFRDVNSSGLDAITVNDIVTSTRQFQTNTTAVEYHKKYPITIPDFLYRIRNLESDITLSPAIAAKISMYDDILKTKYSIFQLENEVRQTFLAYDKFDKEKGVTGTEYPFKADANLNDLLNYVILQINENIIKEIPNRTLNGENYFAVLSAIFKDPDSLKKYIVITPNNAENGPFTFNIDGNEMLVAKINSYANKISETTTESINSLNTDLLKAATDRLGFAPTLKNVIILFLANFETFMTLLYQKSVLAQKNINKLSLEKKPSSYIQNGGVYIANGEVIEHPWPDFFKKITDNKTNSVDYVKAFPGDQMAFKNLEEMKFINELMESVLRIQQDIGSRSLYEVDTRVQINYTPITPEDLPVMFLDGSGKLTLEYDSTSNKIYTSESSANSGQFKFPGTKETTNPTTALSSIITKALENSIYLGFSSVIPKDINKLNFDKFASDMGEAHGNNLYRFYGNKSTVSSTICNILTNKTNDLATDFFTELFINDHEETKVVRDNINKSYRNVFYNTTIFTPANSLKTKASITSIGGNETDRLIYGRAGNFAQIYPRYNTNINTFQKIDLNENYVRKNSNIGDLFDIGANGSVVENSQAVVDVQTVGSKNVDNFNVFKNELLIKTDTAYANKNNESNFNTDNSQKIRKLYIGSTDGDDVNRNEYLKNRYYIQAYETSDAYKSLFRRYQGIFNRDNQTSGLLADTAEVDDDIFIPSPDDTTPVANNGDSNLYERVQALLDTIATEEVGFDISNATLRQKYGDQQAYNRYHDGAIPSDSTSIIQKNGSIGGNIMANWSEAGIPHPRIVVSGSSAAGKYQALQESWVEFSKNYLNEENARMSRANQDKFAICRIFIYSTKKTKNGAKYTKNKKIELLKNNNIQELIGSLSSEWRSIPGYDAQSKHDLNWWVTKYNQILTYNQSNNKTLNAEAKAFLDNILT